MHKTRLFKAHIYRETYLALYDCRIIIGTGKMDYRITEVKTAFGFTQVAIEAVCQVNICS